MKKAFMRRTRITAGILLLLFLCIGQLKAETVGIFYDNTVSQNVFAAGEITTALQGKGHNAELKQLSELTAEYADKKIVLCLAANSTVSQMMVAQGGTAPPALGEQAYALRTTTSGAQSYWVFGGDKTGTMYGGLQVSENIRFNGLIGTYNMQEAPHIRSRGVKYNLPLDARSPTYFGDGEGNIQRAFKGDAAKKAIPHVWDLDYWKEWFDEMARNRFNVIAIWNLHPFPAMLDMDEAFENVEGFDGFFKTMTKAEKTAHWKEVMAYAKGLGFQIYIITWNIYTWGVQDPAVTNNPDNQATRDYFRKAVRLMLETYPHLDGIGLTAGENMHGMSNSEKGVWAWETYGQGMLDYAKDHPERDLTFIHRWHQSKISQVEDNFGPLLALPHVHLDMSYKYSAAHMYSTPDPTLIYTKHGDVPQQLDETEKKTWLELRQDSFYYLEWGDPQFAREYIAGIPDVNRYIEGYFYGPDGWSLTRDFTSRSDVFKGMLEIKRQWYSQMIWGRLTYNPQTSDEVFMNEMAHRYPGVSAQHLFTTWKQVSRGIPLAAEVIQGTLEFDYEWWPELCQRATGFLKITAFANAKPAVGSNVCSIKNTAAGTCSENPRTSYYIADTVQLAAENALASISTLGSGGSPELAIYRKNLFAQIFLSQYLAEKIRGATFNEENKTSEAQTAMGKADCHWKNYVKVMEELHTGADMMRTRNFDGWHEHDAAVLKEYTDLGGDPNHTCTEISTGAASPKDKGRGLEMLGFNAGGLEFYLPEQGTYSVSVYSLSGTELENMRAAGNEPGSQKVMFSTSLKPGVYFSRISADGMVIKHPIIILGD